MSNSGEMNIASVVKRLSASSSPPRQCCYSVELKPKTIRVMVSLERSVRKTIAKKTKTIAPTKRKTPYRQIHVMTCTFVLVGPNNHLVPRKFFPKTKILKATSAHPCGPRTINASFGWANEFLARLGNTFGKREVQKKLDNWSWDVTTCFSGVGCAETVLNSDSDWNVLQTFFSPRVLNPSKPRPRRSDA